jgi:hypothetical protein
LQRKDKEHKQTEHGTEDDEAAALLQALIDEGEYDGDSDDNE